MSKKNTLIKDIEYFFKNIFFSQKYLLKKRLERAVNNNYEEELKIIDKFKNYSKSAIDIGVYRGVYSYKLSKNFKHVYSFEANPILFKYLNNYLSKIIPNITLYNFALSNRNSNTILKIPLRSKSFFKNNIEEIYQLGAASIHDKNNIKKFHKIKVYAKKLDSINIKKKIGFIKIDVEGHEKNVIEGSKKLIKRDKPVLLVEIEERHTKKPIENTINYINSLGYECYYFNKKKIVKKKLGKKILNINNFIFLPRKIINKNEKNYC